MILLQELTGDTVSSGFVLFDKLSNKFFMRLLVDFISVFILVRFIYYPIYRKREVFFTFFIFNLIIFLITFTLNKVEMSMGAAFGLFAVFSMLRYRTEGISIKDMTYLFLVIAMGLLTAVSKGSWDELGLLNIIILVFTYLLESNLFMKRESYKTILYENISMIKPENHQALMDDLKNRTGLNVHRFAIGKISFLRDTAAVKVYYYDDPKKN